MQRAGRPPCELLRRRPQSVLDVGCGSGRFAKDVANLARAAGSAASTSDDQLCAHLENVELGIGNPLAIPYPARSFDAVVSVQVLEYVDDVPAALAEMHRVLKPGGRIVNFATIWATSYGTRRNPRTQIECLRPETACAAS